MPARNKTFSKKDDKIMFFLKGPKGKLPNFDVSLYLYHVYGTMSVVKIKDKRPFMFSVQINHKDGKKRQNKSRKPVL